MWYGAQHFSTDAVPNLRGTKTSEYRKDHLFAIKCYFQSMRHNKMYIQDVPAVLLHTTVKDLITRSSCSYLV